MQLVTKNLSFSKLLNSQPFFAFSYYSNLNLKSQEGTFYAKDVQIKKVATPTKPKWNYDKLKFGTLNSDHLLICDWEKAKGWLKP